ncbi:uncharacterized protein [Clytia hemisphaerica]
MISSKILVTLVLLVVGVKVSTSEEVCKNEQTIRWCIRAVIYPNNNCNKISEFSQKTCRKYCNYCGEGECKDLLKEEDCEKFKDLCGRALYIRTNCRKTCQYCRWGCKDTLPKEKCQRWKPLCDKSPYVKQNCLDTCGVTSCTWRKN